MKTWKLSQNYQRIQLRYLSSTFSAANPQLTLCLHFYFHKSLLRKMNSSDGENDEQFATTQVTATQVQSDSDEDVIVDAVEKRRSGRSKSTEPYLLYSGISESLGVGSDEKGRGRSGLENVETEDPRLLSAEAPSPSNPVGFAFLQPDRRNSSQLSLYLTASQSDDGVVKKKTVKSDHEMSLELSLESSQGSQFSEKCAVSGRASPKSRCRSSLERHNNISQISQLLINQESEVQAEEVAGIAVRAEFIQASGNRFKNSQFSEKIQWDRNKFLCYRVFCVLKRFVISNVLNEGHIPQVESGESTQDDDYTRSKQAGIRSELDGVALGSEDEADMISLSFESTAESQSQTRKYVSYTIPSSSAPSLPHSQGKVYLKQDAHQGEKFVIDETPPVAIEAPINGSKTGWISTCKNENFVDPSIKNQHGGQRKALGAVEDEVDKDSISLDRNLNTYDDVRGASDDEFELGKTDSQEKPAEVADRQRFGKVDVSKDSECKLGKHIMRGKHAEISDCQRIAAVHVSIDGPRVNGGIESSDEKITNPLKRTGAMENAVLKVIRSMLPMARRQDVGVRTFYYQVKKKIGKNLDDEVWLPFVWDAVVDIIDSEKGGGADSEHNGLPKHLNNGADRLLSQVASQSSKYSQGAVSSHAEDVKKSGSEIYEEWTLSKHRECRNPRSEGARRSPSAKRGSTNRISHQSLWRLAKDLIGNDIDEMLLDQDETWRTLYRGLKEKGWTWKYGSGVVSKKYYAPGYENLKKKEEKEWLGTRIFYQIKDVIAFVYNNETPGESDLLAASKGIENSASLSEDKDSSSGDEDEMSMDLMLRVAAEHDDKMTDPPYWGAIFSVLKEQGWKYKSCSKLSGGWEYIRPKDAGNAATTIYSDPRAVVRALCVEKGISFDALAESQELNPSRRTRNPPKRYKVEQTPTKVLTNKACANTVLVSGCDDGGKPAVTSGMRTESNPPPSHHDFALVAFLKEAAETLGEDPNRDPVGWGNIFEILKFRGWEYKPAPKHLTLVTSWVFIEPAERKGGEPIVHNGSHDVIRTLCRRRGISIRQFGASSKKRRRRPVSRLADDEVICPKKYLKKLEAMTSPTSSAKPSGKNKKRPAGLLEENHLVSSPSSSSEIVVKKMKQRREKKLFTGFHFILSGIPPLERKEIQSLVRQHGGQVHREIARFEKVMQDCERTPQEDDGLMTAFLVLSNCEPTAYRRAKYLYSLAVDVPVVHFSWVKASISRMQLLKILPSFVLPSGLSLRRGRYVFPSNASTSTDVSGEMVLLSPKPTNISVHGVFYGLSIGLMGVNLGQGPSAEHSDWWYILAMAGATVHEGPLSKIKKQELDCFVVRMEDFGILPELRKLAKRRNVPIVTFEWCIQCLIDKVRIPFDAFAAFATGQAGGGTTKRAKRRILWASSMVGSENEIDRKSYTAVKVSGERYCLGEFVYVRLPFVHRDDVEKDKNARLKLLDTCRLGIVDKFWEMKDTEEKKVRWRPLHLCGEGLGVVVRTDEFIESPVEYLEGKFIAFDTPFHDELSYLRAKPLLSPSSSNQDTVEASRVYRIKDKKFLLPERS